jgi:hypothetical protein
MDAGWSRDDIRHATEMATLCDGREDLFDHLRVNALAVRRYPSIAVNHGGNYDADLYKGKVKFLQWPNFFA